MTHNPHLRLADFAADPLVPSLSTLRITSADDPMNQALRKLVLDPPQDPAQLAGKRFAILATDGVEELELIVPYRFFTERGATVHLVSPRFAPTPTNLGIAWPASRATHILTIRFLENAGQFPIDTFLDEARVDNYDALIIPGGAWNPDILRGDPAVLKFVKEFHATGKPTTALCHGPQVLLSAGLLNGKKATSYWSIRVDLENAGATVSDDQVVVDGNIITARFVYDLPPFLEAIVAAVAQSGGKISKSIGLNE